MDARRFPPSMACVFVIEIRRTIDCLVSLTMRLREQQQLSNGNATRRPTLTGVGRRTQRRESKAKTAKARSARTDDRCVSDGPIL
jgi:hypothetical protein